LCKALNQKQLLCEFVGKDGQITIIFDADEAGEKGALDCLRHLASSVFVKNITLDKQIKKPHRLSIETIKELL